MTYALPPSANVSIENYHYIGNRVYLVLVSCAIWTQSEKVRNEALSAVVYNDRESTNEYELTEDRNQTDGKIKYFIREQYIYENFSCGSYLHCKFWDATVHRSFESPNIIFQPQPCLPTTETKTQRKLSL